MIGEINIDGVFISPLLLCLVCAFFSRMALSWTLSAVGVYRWVAQLRIRHRPVSYSGRAVFPRPEMAYHPLRTPCFVNVLLLCCAPR